MFLNEAALGKEHSITMDDWRLTAPPSGYDCIVARGRTEPGKDISLWFSSQGHEYSLPVKLCMNVPSETKPTQAISIMVHLFYEPCLCFIFLGYMSACILNAVHT